MFPLHHCHQGLTLCNAGQGRRNLVCLYWTGFLGLHYTWVEASLQDLAISDFKVARPLQGHQHSSWRTPVLKLSSNSTVPVAWIVEPSTDSQFNYELIIFTFQGMELHDDVTWILKLWENCLKEDNSLGLAINGVTYAVSQYVKFRACLTCERK